MKTAGRFSRKLLVIEALLLIPLNLLALITFFSCFAGFFYWTVEHSLNFKSIFIVLSNTLAFLSFYSLWHIFADVMTREFEKGKKLNRNIGLFAFLGAVFSIAMALLFIFNIPTGIAIFAFGILYVPTYLHLLLELQRQTGMKYLIGTITKEKQL